MIRAFLLSAAAAFAGPHLARVAPLGAQVGTVVEVELTGSELEQFSAVSFGTPHLEWLETLSRTKTAVKGRVRVSANAPLGPHRIQALTAAGPSNSRLFNVHEFPAVAEIEPGQTIELRPQVIHGYMKDLADQDFFTFRARPGERWLFDLQSIERGGFLECSLTLTENGGKEVAHNEDQDEYLETPRLSHRFTSGGLYTLKIDQYRGPQGVSCSENCGYQLVVSQLPVVQGIFPLGASPGAVYKVRVIGEALESVTGARLVRARGAEHYRLTFPFTMPVDGADPDSSPIPARKVSASPSAVEAEFAVPPGASPGLWRLWLTTSNGTAEAMSVEIGAFGTVHDGVLNGDSRYDIQLEAGRPFHAWTVAAQLGLPEIDTVLELWAEDGKLLAEHDDLMTGQGTVIGNPDSSLYYTPAVSGKARLVVRDRTGRTGPSFAYRLHMDSSSPGFQLLFEPEELAVRAGQEAEIEALLIKEPGFEKAVDVWVEGHPEVRGQFRADQHFGPSGDGDNINIPSVRLRIRVPAGTRPGPFPIRLRARAADGSGKIVQGLATLWIGPKGKRNDTRRPLAQPSVFVIP